MTLKHSFNHPKYLTLCTILILISFSAKSQMFFNDGYIIEKNNEKKYGKIKQIDSRSIKFFNEKGRVTIYTADEIEAYQIDNIPYKKCILNTSSQPQLVFLKEILIGYLSLYEIPKGPADANFVIKKGDGEFQLLKSESAPAEFRKAIYDSNNPALLQKTTRKVFRYDRTGIENLVMLYNSKMKPNEEIIKPKARFIYEFGITGGLSQNQVNYSGFRDNLFVKANGKIGVYNFTPFGIRFGIQPHKTFSLETEIIYNQYSGTRHFEYSSSTQDYQATIRFEEQSVLIPLNLRLAIIQKPFIVRLKLGPQYVYEKKVESYYTSRYVNDASLFRLDLRSGIGFNAGLALTKKFNDKFYVGLEYRYSQYDVSDGVTKVATRSSNQIFISLSVSNQKRK